MTLRSPCWKRLMISSFFTYLKNSLSITGSLRRPPPGSSGFLPLSQILAAATRRPRRCHPRQLINEWSIIGQGWLTYGTCLLELLFFGAELELMAWAVELYFLEQRSLKQALNHAFTPVGLCLLVYINLQGRTSIMTLSTNPFIEAHKSQLQPRMNAIIYPERHF